MLTLGFSSVEDPTWMAVKTNSFALPNEMMTKCVRKV